VVLVRTFGRSREHPATRREGIISRLPLMLACKKPKGFGIAAHSADTVHRRNDGPSAVIKTIKTRKVSRSLSSPRKFSLPLFGDHAWIIINPKSGGFIARQYYGKRKGGSLSCFQYSIPHHQMMVAPTSAELNWSTVRVFFQDPPVNTVD